MEPLEVKVDDGVQSLGLGSVCRRVKNDPTNEKPIFYARSPGLVFNSFTYFT